jgi:hypothetical protein
MMLSRRSFSSKLLLVLVSVVSLAVSQAFFAPVPGWKQTTSRKTTTVALKYRNDPQKEAEEEASRQQQREAKKDDGIYQIPVLGPFPGHAPLMMGSDLTLNPPTPFQWQALEECVHTHQRHLQLSNNDTDGDAQIYDHAKAASIDAAPLVAIMDDYTTGEVLLPGIKKNGRYATIAAVVGISSSLNSKNKGSKDNRSGGNADDDSDYGQILDTSDQSSFMESIDRIGRTATPLESKIRLVGIGRAVLYDFYHQIPTSQPEVMDEEGEKISGKSDTDSDEDDDEETNRVTNIVMANFRLLMDSTARSEDLQNSKGGRPMHASPVHALAEMSNMANKIQRTHVDRRRYVAGLQAAKSRLKRKEAKLAEEELEDYDGLGMLFSGRDSEEDGDADADADADAAQPLIEQFLNEFHHDAPVEHTRLVGMENYGMGYSAASISTIFDLTSVWTEKLQPYYSPSRCESEEHYFEILSFVSVLSMDKYLHPSELGWTLHCTNTIERLHQAYEWMFEHVCLLKQESEKISQELRDCGEECTDLW